MLSVSGMTSGYGRVRVLDGVDVNVQVGEVVTVIGPNGAGKTTLLRSIVGEIRPWTGSVSYEDKSLIGMNARNVRKSGVGYVPQGRHLFQDLTVRENLKLGVCVLPRSKHVEAFHDGLGWVLSLFPPVESFLDRPAGTLSGGEQQMVAVGRALMSHPSLLLLDEPSMGLAPRPLKHVLDVVQELKISGVSTIVVEQVAASALAIADRAYVLREGKIRDEAVALTLLADRERLVKAYFG